jgi:hypothetical protein
MAEWGLPATHVLIDHDTTYTEELDALLADDGCTVTRVGPRGANLTALRFEQRLRNELLDHFVVPGARNLRHLTDELIAHYASQRPHPSMGNVPHTGDRLTEQAERSSAVFPFPANLVWCQSRFARFLRHDHRAAT